MKTRKLLYILPLAALVACEPEFEDVDFNQGSADFSNYVAVGNSLTAGFQSNALRRNKQINSFPAILAKQMQEVGGGEFKQPLLDEGVGIGAELNAEFGLFLEANCAGEVGPSPKPIASQGQIDQFNFPSAMIGGQGYNNLGVPGAKSFHLAANGYGNPAGVLQGTANPFYARFVNPDDHNESIITAAVSAQPTFFSLWIGNNDVLGYATSGGEGIDQTGNTDPSSYGSNDITDPNVFTSVYNQLVSALNAEAKGGVVANIPDVTSIPFLNTVKWNQAVLDANQAAALNNAFAPYNMLVQGNLQAGIITQAEADLRTISFNAGANGFLIVDSDLTQLLDSVGSPVQNTFFRQIKQGEYITLRVPTDSLECYYYGLANPQTGQALPIAEKYVLDADEVQNVKDATESYNTTIKQIANANGLAFVDANKIMKQLKNGGLTYGGATYTAEFVSGGFFSLDGVHPTTRGNAIMANEFIKAINNTYGANLPEVDVNSYGTFQIQ